MKRPLLASCRSLAICARSIGLRAKATAMLVISSMRSVCSAASKSGKKGPCGPSNVNAPS